MTDQADALAGKLKRWDQEYSYAWFVAEYAKRGFQDGSATIAYFTGLAAVATAHFAEEIARRTCAKGHIYGTQRGDQDEMLELLAMTDQADALAVELGFTLGEGATKDIAAFKAALLKMRNDNLALTSENERLKGKCEDIERAYEDLRRRFVQSEQDLAHGDADTRHTIAQLHQADATLARVREFSSKFKQACSGGEQCRVHDELDLILGDAVR